MLKTILRRAGSVLCAAASLALFTSAALAQGDQQKLVVEAESRCRTSRDRTCPGCSRTSRSKALIIAPEIVKAGFIFGGSGGRALVVVRDPASGKWVGPAFYIMATGSVGFQAGISVSEGVTMVMTDKGFNSLLATSFKMGGDASVAAGPVGAGAKSDIVSDLITFNRAKGVYGGLNFDGTVVTAADDWNQAYFGKKVLPPDILVRMSVTNRNADGLLAKVTAATAKK
jgi:lipid-binding SYLF domain-containing protein